MLRIFLAFIISLSLCGVASAQDDPPAPCGPSGDLPSNLSRNVASDSSCFEIRMYTAEPEKTARVGSIISTGASVKARSNYLENTVLNSSELGRDWTTQTPWYG